MRPYKTTIKRSNINSILENRKQAKQYVAAGKLSQDDFDNLVRIDPTDTKKYVGYMAKIYINQEVPMSELESYIPEYHVFVKNNKTEHKDINVFKSFDDLKRHVDHLNNIGASVSVKDLEKEYDTIVNNNRILMLSPKNHAASRKIGLKYFAVRACADGSTDCAWCTTYKSPNHWKSYYNDLNLTFYYVRLRADDLIEKAKEITDKLPSVTNCEVETPLIVSAIVVKPDFEIDSVWDGLDRNISSTGSTEEYLEMIRDEVRKATS